MSIRKMKLKDYGITPGRAAELKEMVKDKQYYSLVIEACNDLLSVTEQRANREKLNNRRTKQKGDFYEWM